jgi:hypothetical protein
MTATMQYQDGRDDNAPQPIRGNLGAPILGPRNVPLERENPNLLASPATDAGTIPNLKFSFAAARNRLLSGGWAREVTVRELPTQDFAATTVARENQTASATALQPRGNRPTYRFPSQSRALSLTFPRKVQFCAFAARNDGATRQRGAELCPRRCGAALS